MNDDIPETEKLEHPHGRILAMDDQYILGIMIERMLNRMGYDVALAKDGDTAVEIFREAFHSGSPFDLVILDLTVPGGMGGVDTLAELLKVDPEIKALASSGSSNDPIMTNYRDYGFCGVIPKPYTKKELSDAISTVIGGK